uniref:Uncharacterized protein n=1 Tax=Anguilla anguilla TaxID=7936 RepID=A0A0E9V7U8_ANGAN
MLKGLGSMETRCRNAPRIGNLQQTFRVLILHKSGGFSSSLIWIVALLALLVKSIFK